jgi:hypothetical protein
MSEDTLDDWDYHEETVIGHHVGARIEEKTELDKQLDEVSEQFDIARWRPSPMVEIEVGDVDWDETKTVRIRLDTLTEMADVLYAEHESE